MQPARFIWIRRKAAGLFRPITLWPFPIQHLLPLLPKAKALVVVEASAGQLEDELRLSLSHADVHAPPRISRVNHYGGILPQQHVIVECVRAAVAAPKSSTSMERALS